MRTSDKPYVRENENFLRQYLSEHPCVLCGEKSALVLSFRHRTKKGRSGGIKAMSRQGRPSLLKQLENCYIICANCSLKSNRSSQGPQPTLRPLVG